MNPKDDLFHTASAEEIKAGKVTDVYFDRTIEVLKRKGIDKVVKMEVFLKKFPYPENWGVLAGVEECIRLLSDIPVNVRFMDEGTIFRRDEPVMLIEGRYLDFGHYETAILGLLCQASGIATKAARCRLAAPNKAIVSFGARRMHPAIAPMVERSAFLGGCDGVAAVKSAELLGEAPVGTMPHALILIIGDTVEATKAFDEVIDPKIRRVALIDTFNDEKFEAIRVAQALKDRLYGVRLDTPASRRGNLVKILKEVRWELDSRGFNDVKLFVSGGLEEDLIAQLSPVADAFGVGTCITNARVLDFALDIVEVEGVKVAKRGKMSGTKQVYRCQLCQEDFIIPSDEEKSRCHCGGVLGPLLFSYLVNGKGVRPLPSPQDIKKFVLFQLGNERLMDNPFREAVLEGGAQSLLER